MKKLGLLIAAIFICMVATTAGPVDVETAKLAGTSFVAASFKSDRGNADLQLVETGFSNRETACYYVFNVGDQGFVILSADDRFRPIVGYSDEGTFATEDRAPELDFYLEKIVEARMSPEVVLYDDAEAEWQSLLLGGKPFSRNGGRGVPYICQTKWNQNSPYNLYAPEASGGPGGRCYAGCVATAMSQVMRQWCEPIHGTGSHGYYSSYGYLSVNFGNTTYDWDHMPYRIGTSSPEEEIEAIALLMYHCGVAVNMGFGPTGSGAYSDDVPDAIRQYFGYSNQAHNYYRNYYTLSAWKDLLKEQFDLGWSVYYSGHSDSGGHAFVCDGYDDNDLFHFNWGWGGSSDGWFVVDEIDYNNWAAAIVNFVPSNVYLYMPLEPSNFTVETLGDNQFTANLSWTNPTHNIRGEALTSLDEVVVCRDGQPIHTFANPSPGQAMSFTDHYLPVAVAYSVYAVFNSAKSKPATMDKTVLGPTCVWTVDMQSSSPQGWHGCEIVVTDGKGQEIMSLTATSNEQTKTVELPLGKVSFSWKQGETTVEHIHFEIKNSDGDLMASCDGSTANLKNGVFFQSSNNCHPDETLTAPSNLSTTVNNNDVLLQWEMNDEDCLFFVYRDGLLCNITSAPSYVDLAAANQFHNYYITAYNGSIESYPSNVCNVQQSSDCLQPTNLRSTKVSSNKVLLKWDAPSASGLSGYKIYRRAQGGEFVRIKSTSSTSCEEQLTALPCGVYEYTVTAYYAQSHCESAYASSKADPSLNFIEVNKSIIPMHLGTDVNADGIRLVWLDALVADSYMVYRNGSPIATGLTGNTYLDVNVTADHDYCYTVVGLNPNISSNASNVACVDWSTMAVSEAKPGQEVTVYPNPAGDQVTVSAVGLKRVTVINLMGQVVMTNAATDDTMNVSLTSLVPGTYFVRVESEQDNTMVKIVVVR